MAERGFPDRFRVEPEVERSGVANGGRAGALPRRHTGIIFRVDGVSDYKRFLANDRMIANGFGKEPLGTKTYQVGILEQGRLRRDDLAGDVAKPAQQIVAIVDNGKSKLAFQSLGQRRP